MFLLPESEMLIIRKTENNLDALSDTRCTVDATPAFGRIGSDGQINNRV